jgi:outer membrane protein OmpA-like peptidoglycan-associated protein
VYFSLNSANIANRKAILDKAARSLTDSANLHVVIEGHADPTGTHEGNMVLSQRRAEAVRDYLVSAGIDQSRMEVVPFGDTRLKYGRTDGRNRRVAIEPKQ